MKLRIVKQARQLLLATLLALCTLSCETEIPPEDPTPPKFSFQITGDGFNRVFDQDTDFEDFQLRLKNGALYSYTFSGGDQGGVERIQWFINGSNFITLQEAVTAPWTYSSSPLQSLIEWRGSRSNPLTGNVITGSFRAQGGNVAISFRFNVVDFGGERRNPNSSRGELNLYIGDHSTEITPL